jgi:hypothetical protein
MYGLIGRKESHRKIEKWIWPFSVRARASSFSLFYLLCVCCCCSVPIVYVILPFTWWLVSLHLSLFTQQQDRQRRREAAAVGGRKLLLPLALLLLSVGNQLRHTFCNCCYLSSLLMVVQLYFI